MQLQRLSNLENYPLPQVQTVNTQQHRQKSLNNAQHRNVPQSQKPSTNLSDDILILDQLMLNGKDFENEKRISSADLNVLQQKSQSQSEEQISGDSDDNKLQQNSSSSASNLPLSELNPIQKKRLQIIRKLQEQDICSPDEYQHIIHNLVKQNDKLQMDLQLLRQKVDLLKLKQLRRQRQQTKVQHQNQLLPQQEYKNLKTILRKKYQELKKFQKKSSKSTTKFALEIQYREFVNKLIELETSSEELKGKLKDEKKINKKLKKQLKQYDGITLSSSKQSQQLETYNKELKNKIFLMKKIISSQEQSELEVQKYQLQIKSRQKKVFEGLRISANRLKLLQKAKNIDTQKQNLLTKTGIYDFYTMDSKVRAKTEFSFQKNLEYLQNVQYPVKIQDHFKALTQIGSSTSKQIKKFEKLQQNQKPLIKHFVGLNKQEINTLKQNLKEDLKSIQNLSVSLQGRLSLLLEQQGPSFKKSRSIQIFTKKKNMLLTRNKILLEELRKSYDQKIQLFLKYNIAELNCEFLQNKGGSELDGIKHNFSSFSRREAELVNLPLLPLINKQNQFNRSKSQMKFRPSSRKQQNQEKAKTILLGGQSLGKYQRTSFTINDDINLPSMSQYENGRSQKKNLSQDKNFKTEPELRTSNLASTSSNHFSIQRLEQGTQTQFQLKAILQSINQSKDFKNSVYAQDFIGQIELDNCDFDDRLYMTLDQNMHINQFTVYHTPEGISLIKAKYKFSNPRSLYVKFNRQDQPEDFVSSDFSYRLSQSLLQPTLKYNKVQESVTQLSINDYIKHIKVLFNTKEGFVSKIQLVSHYNVKYEFGNQELAFPTALTPCLNIYGQDQDQKKKRSKSRHKQFAQKAVVNIKFYQIDIKPNEYPSFMFGSYKLVENRLMLAGLGFVINKSL